MNERSNAPPRNYFPLAVQSVQCDGIQQTHDRLWMHHEQTLSGALELEIEVLAPVHVGSGSFTLADDQPVKDLARRGPTPVIPGSSLKGSCRQTHEVLTQSGLPFKEGRGRDAPPLSASATLFGSLAGQGRISFDDAAPRTAPKLRTIRLSVPYSPRKVVGRRFYGPMPRGAEQEPRIPALAFPAGTCLRTTLRFRNTPLYELGSVLCSLGMGDPPFCPKLGGGKYDPFGWVRFRALRFRLAAGLESGCNPWESDFDKVQVFCTRLLEAVILSPAGNRALDELQRRMQPPPSELGGVA